MKDALKLYHTMANTQLFKKNNLYLAMTQIGKKHILNYIATQTGKPEAAGPRRNSRNERKIWYI